MKPSRLITSLSLFVLHFFNETKANFSVEIPLVGPGSLVDANVRLSSFEVTMLNNNDLLVCYENLSPVKLACVMYSHDGHLKIPEFKIDEDGTDQKLINLEPTHNGFMAIWQHLTPTEDLEIKARKFNIDGTPQSNVFTVNAYAGGAQSNAVIKAFEFEYFLCVWQSFQQDGDGWGIRARPLDSSGSPYLTTEWDVNSNTVGDQIAPAAATLYNQQFLITWRDNGELKARFYDRFWIPVSEFSISTNVSPTQTQSSVYKIPGGDFFFLVAWTNSAEQIIGQIFNYIGQNPVAVGSEFRLNNSDSGKPQRGLNLKIAKNGQIFVTWEEAGKIFAQLLNANLSFVTDAFEVSQGQSSSVNLVHGGGYIVSYSSAGILWSKRFNENAEPLNWFIENCYASTDPVADREENCDNREYVYEKKNLYSDCLFAKEICDAELESNKTRLENINILLANQDFNDCMPKNDQDELVWRIECLVNRTKTVEKEIKGLQEQGAKTSNALQKKVPEVVKKGLTESLDKAFWSLIALGAAIGSMSLIMIAIHCCDRSPKNNKQPSLSVQNLSSLLIITTITLNGDVFVRGVLKGNIAKITEELFLIFSIISQCIGVIIQRSEADQDFMTAFAKYQHLILMEALFIIFNTFGLIPYLSNCSISNILKKLPLPPKVVHTLSSLTLLAIITFMAGGVRQVLTEEDYLEASFNAISLYFFSLFLSQGAPLIIRAFAQFMSSIYWATTRKSNAQVHVNLELEEQTVQCLWPRQAALTYFEQFASEPIVLTLKNGTYCLKTSREKIEEEVVPYDSFNSPSLKFRREEVVFFLPNSPDNSNSSDNLANNRLELWIFKGEHKERASYQVSLQLQKELAYKKVSIAPNKLLVLKFPDLVFSLEVREEGEKLPLVKGRLSDSSHLKEIEERLKYLITEGEKKLVKRRRYPLSKKSHTVSKEVTTGSKKISPTTLTITVSPFPEVLKQSTHINFKEYDPKKPLSMRFINFFYCERKRGGKSSIELNKNIKNPKKTTDPKIKVSSSEQAYNLKKQGGLPLIQPTDNTGNSILDLDLEPPLTGGGSRFFIKSEKDLSSPTLQPSLMLREPRNRLTMKDPIKQFYT